MQTLNITSFTDDKLWHLAHKIPEIKRMSIHSINSMLTKLRAYKTNFWSPLKVKAFSTICSMTAVLGIITLAIGLYCKCNKME